MAPYINQTGKLKEVKEKPFKLEKYETIDKFSFTFLDFMNRINAETRIG